MLVILLLSGIRWFFWAELTCNWLLETDGDWANIGARTSSSASSSEDDEHDLSYRCNSTLWILSIIFWNTSVTVKFNCWLQYSDAPCNCIEVSHKIRIALLCQQQLTCMSPFPLYSSFNNISNFEKIFLHIVRKYGIQIVYNSLQYNQTK